MCLGYYCLASEVRLNVDLDTAMTVVAKGCYRWLAAQLRGFEKAKPKQLCSKFAETGGVIIVPPIRFWSASTNDPTIRSSAKPFSTKNRPRSLGSAICPLAFEYP